MNKEDPMRKLRSHLLVVGCILMSLSSQAWAANLRFGQTQTGEISAAAQTNSYTFTGHRRRSCRFYRSHHKRHSQSDLPF
jgi:hypothetical protein